MDKLCFNEERLGEIYMFYQGSCHCGKIAFEIQGDEIQQVTECNCSICSKRGSLMWFISRDQMKLKTPESNLAIYMFNKKHIQHHFCATCGCAPFGEGLNPKTNTMMAAVNVRCLDDFDVSKLKVMPFDGKRL